MSLRFIYFDLGNVLLAFDHAIACRRIAQLSGVAESRVRQVVFEGDLQVRYESGQLGDRAFCDAFRSLTGCQVADEPLLHAASDIFTANTQVVSIVYELAQAGCRLGILSNTCPAHWRHIVTGPFPFVRECFEQYVLSFECRSMKPHAPIFAAAVQRAGVDPGEVFFVDDRPENVFGARRFGLDAEPFTSADQLRQQLQQRGVPLQGTNDQAGKCASRETLAP